MKLTKKLITIGRGTISSACVIDGIANFVIKAEGKLIQKNMRQESSQLYGYSTVGYGDAVWLLPSGKLARVGEELLYEPNK